MTFQNLGVAQACVTDSPSKRFQTVQNTAENKRVSTKNIRNEWSGCAVCSLASAALEFKASPSQKKTEPAALSLKNVEVGNIMEKNIQHKCSSPK
jgi:hypothetical protein